MSRIQRALHNDFLALEVLRDELIVQHHLFHAEARKQWQELETRWSDLKEHLQRARVSAATAEPEIEAAAKLTIDALKSGYTDFKNALKH